MKLPWSTQPYIPMSPGFMNLVAVMDWYSRKVPSWQLSNTLEADFCAETLKAIGPYGRPGIFNTDQETQFTSESFTEVLKDTQIPISMDSRGRLQDKIFIQRLW